MASRIRSRSTINIWPGFVDVLSSLIIAIMFVLLAFVLSQLFLTQSISSRDSALHDLNARLAEMGEILALEKRTNDELRVNLTQLSATLQSATKERNDLVLQLNESNTLTERLAGRVHQLTETVVADKDAIRVQLLELERLRQAREDLETKLSIQEKAIQQRELRLSELQALYLARQSDLDSEKRTSAAAQAQAALLNQQLQALRQQLAAIQDALQSAESKDQQQQVMISDLGRRLNQALAQRVEELSRYRSEFFGRLREILGNRRDVVVVGDRFVFQSEVLFPSASAQLGDEGKAQMRQLAAAIKEIMPRIPNEIDWVLRVDGHTDAVPISTPQFPSNWELSSARAISVVQFLIANGIPARRLAATGFGEFQPLDTGRDEIAFRRNRRIELKLTDR